MPSNKRQKELARRRAERQAARRVQERTRRRKRRILGALTVGGVAAAVAAIVFLVTTLSDGDDSKLDPAAASGTPTPSATPGDFKTFPVACGGKRPAEPKVQTFGNKAPEMTIDKTKKYTMTIKTSCGDIVIDLDAENAPNTVNSFAFLAEKNFYDGSICHRMNDAPEFQFLQCGDPTGTGGGSAPGYTIAEENTKDAKYVRGTLAMANTGQPNSTGSQFFLVAQDAKGLPPNYTVAGQVTKGLDVLDQIIKVGTDGAFEPNPGGGHPKQAVYIEELVVTAK